MSVRESTVFRKRQKSDIYGNVRFFLETMHSDNSFCQERIFSIREISKCQVLMETATQCIFRGSLKSTSKTAASKTVDQK